MCHWIHFLTNILLQLKYLELFKLAYLQKSRYYSAMDKRRFGANEDEMTRRNSKTETIGAIAFVVCALLIVCACALVAFASGDAAAVLVVAALGAIAAPMARFMAIAFAFELLR